MFCATLVLGFSVILSVTPIQAAFAPKGRMTGGSSVETLRRFPHHVLIKEYNSYKDNETERRFCGGSIMNQHWILTAASCVKSFDVLEVSFQRLFLTKTNGSYSAVVNRDAVYEYPTQYDDIALIKMPFTLDFSDTVQSVEIYSGSNIAAGQFVVLPGYENSYYGDFYPPTTPATTDYPPQQNLRLNPENKMVYGMFSVLSSVDCKAGLGKEFDEYLQYCTKSWTNTRNSPSTLDIGSGLLIGWPARPQLVGIYIGSNNSKNAAIYTNAAKYLDWIRGFESDIPV